MVKSIWDLTEGMRFRTVDAGLLCEVITKTEDGKGLLGRYLEGTLTGQEDFIFETEIDFRSATASSYPNSTD